MPPGKNFPYGTLLIRIFITRATNKVHLEDDVILRNKDPLNWWRSNKLKYPKLYRIAQEKLCAHAKAGQILNEPRTRLSDNKVKILLFLNSYLNNFSSII